MEPRNDDEIVIYDEDGNEFLMNILFTYENEERGAEYVFLYDNATTEDIVANSACNAEYKLVNNGIRSVAA